MKKFLLVVSAAMIVMSAQAMAGIKREVVASFDITPCSKTDNYRDDLGITWPTIKFARQSTELVVSTNHSPDLSVESYRSALNECNGLALIAAAGVSFALNPTAFVSTYEATYAGCMYARLGGEITGIGVAAESRCHW